MLWIVDASAWARRGIPQVQEQLDALLGERDDNELVMSPSVLLELLRGAQGNAVAEARAELADAMTTLATDAQTFALAASAMEKLALTGAEAHRVSVSDLITAALAHQYAGGVVHVDEDFERLAAHSGLTFEQRRLALPEQGEGAPAHPAARQRALVKQLRQLLHQRPRAEAEAVLERAIADLRGGPE
jgi:predicted nucleic acid-binding protein